MPQLNLLESMAREEGWLDLKSRPRRNNNPGDIEFGRFAQAHGATHSDGRFAVFPTAEAGFSAMRALLTGPAYRGLTVAQAIAKYAPSNENNVQSYVENVCAWSGCKPQEIIDPLLNAAPWMYYQAI
jgi:hypothetical protein